MVLALHCPLKDMSTGFQSVITSLKLKEREVELIAHNLSNANTNGFKESRIKFESVMETSSTTGEQIQTVTGRTFNNFQQGEIASTSQPWDFAIMGDGFFEIETDKGTFYTRNGTFALDTEGYVVTHNGFKVMGANGALRVSEAGDVRLGPDGTLLVGENEIGKMKIVTFDNMKDVSQTGGTLLQAGPGAQAREMETPTVVQGKLELSNVSVVGNLARLIEASKQFQSYQKIMAEKSKVDEQIRSNLGRIG